MGGSQQSKRAENDVGPRLDSSSVDDLCRKAYAAGAADASAHYQALLESQWGVDTAAAMCSCAIVLFLSCIYFSTRAVHGETIVGDGLHTQVGQLMETGAQLQHVVDRSLCANRRVVRCQMRIKRSLASLRRRTATLAKDVEAIKKSVARVNQHMITMQYGGGAMLGCFTIIVCLSALTKAFKDK